MNLPKPSDKESKYEVHFQRDGRVSVVDIGQRLSRVEFVFWMHSGAVARSFNIKDLMRDLPKDLLLEFYHQAMAEKFRRDGLK